MHIFSPNFPNPIFVEIRRLRLWGEGLGQLKCRMNLETVSPLAAVEHGVALDLLCSSFVKVVSLPSGLLQKIVQQQIGC